MGVLSTTRCVLRNQKRHTHHIVADEGKPCHGSSRPIIRGILAVLRWGRPRRPGRPRSDVAQGDRWGETVRLAGPTRAVGIEQACQRHRVVGQGSGTAAEIRSVISVRFSRLKARIIDGS